MYKRKRKISKITERTLEDNNQCVYMDLSGWVTSTSLQTGFLGFVFNVNVKCVCDYDHDTQGKKTERQTHPLAINQPIYDSFICS